jgi:hypothetical protein
MRTLFEAFDLRVVYDKAGDWLSISATLTEAVAAMLRTGLEPLFGTSLWGTGCALSDPFGTPIRFTHPPGWRIVVPSAEEPRARA